jgi:tetratricopeptide (TPR) repeat protein
MSVALPHALRDGWVITVPEADFIASDGTRLEAKGVEPDVKAPPNEVFLPVGDYFGAMLPYSAAVLCAGSYEALKRTAEAEHAYRTALRLAERQHPAPGTVSLISVRKRLAAILTAKGDREAALSEYREVLKLVPNDAEALAAVRAGRGN